jgi:hypothetical protein
MTTMNWEKASQRDRIARNGHCDIRKADPRPPKSRKTMRVEFANLLRKTKLNAGQRRRLRALRSKLKSRR